MEGKIITVIFFALLAFNFAAAYYFTDCLVVAEVLDIIFLSLCLIGYYLED